MKNGSPEFRVGLGLDTHRLVAGGPLRIGGIDIEFDFRLQGHSDADVLLHAITDAILGASGAGEIGELFPNTAEENRGKDSAEMLRIAVERAIEKGFSIVNIDCVILAERPKFLPWKRRIAERIASIIGVEPDLVGVKAKTGEGIGPVGTGAVIESHCVALLKRERV